MCDFAEPAPVTISICAAKRDSGNQLMILDL